MLDHLTSLKWNDIEIKIWKQNKFLINNQSVNHWWFYRMYSVLTKLFKQSIELKFIQGLFLTQSHFLASRGRLNFGFCRDFTKTIWGKNSVQQFSLFCTNFFLSIFYSDQFFFVLKNVFQNIVSFFFSNTNPLDINRHPFALSYLDSSHILYFLTPSFLFLLLFIIRCSNKKMHSNLHIRSRDANRLDFE